MYGPNMSRTSTKTCKSPAVAAHSENHSREIDEQMRRLLQRLGQLVGRAIAATDRSEHHQNDILKNLDPE